MAFYAEGVASHPTRKQRAARKRQRRMGQVEHDLTDEQWLALMRAWGGCAYCGGDGAALQRDCVQPISRGGRYRLRNVVPACGSCNASKSNLEVTAWMRRRRFDEQAFLLRSYTIEKELAHTFPIAAETTALEVGGSIDLDVAIEIETDLPNSATSENAAISATTATTATTATRGD